MNTFFLFFLPTHLSKLPVLSLGHFIKVSDNIIRIVLCLFYVYHFNYVFSLLVNISSNDHLDPQNLVKT